VRRFTYGAITAVADSTNSIKREPSVASFWLTKGRKRHGLSAEEERAFKSCFASCKTNLGRHLYVACIFLCLLGVQLSMLFNKWRRQLVTSSLELCRGITSYLPVGSVILFILNLIRFVHIKPFIHGWILRWIATDKLIANKSGY
jgi:hypothetical protein